MLTNKNVYVAPGPGREDVIEMLAEAGYNILYDPNKDRVVDLVVLVGGTDVHPYTYLHYEQAHTRYDFERDVREFKLVRACENNGIPVVGICRGSQLLCVHNRGKLIQDVQGHAIGGTHEAVGFTRKGEPLSVQVNSTHHQVSVPNDDNGHVILWANCGRKHSLYNRMGERVDVTDQIEGYGTGDQMDAEVTYYPEHYQLGIQYHPEWMYKDSDGRKLALNLIADVVKRRTPSVRI